jgi:hypothetical protein
MGPTPNSPDGRRMKWLPYTVAAIAVVIVVSLAALWSGGQPSGSNQNAKNPPPYEFVMVGNGTKFALPASGFYTSGPFNLTNNSEWAPSGAWWSSNGTTDCFVTTNYYTHWNHLTVPTKCDGWGYYGSPGIGGFFSMPTGWALQAGTFFLVWFNLSDTTSTLVNVTAVIMAAMIGGSCSQTYPPPGCRG